MTTVQQIKELYKVIKQNGQATTAKCIVGANANIYTNLGINLSGTTAAPNPYSVMIGQNSSAQDDHSIAIGRGVYAKGGCVALGQYTTMTPSDDFKVVIGDGNDNVKHNCFTSDGSIVTIDNNIVTIGNNASVVNIGNKEGIGVNIGNGVNSWIYLGYGTSSHTLIGEGNYSTVGIGNAGYTHTAIGGGAYGHVVIGNGINYSVSIGDGSRSTVSIGNSLEGDSIWSTSNILFNSPITSDIYTSDIYVPIKFDYDENMSSSQSPFQISFPLKINNTLYTLSYIPKGTKYKITVTSDLSWDESQTSSFRLNYLTLGTSTVVSYTGESINNDTNNSRSVFVADTNLSTTHDHISFYITPPSAIHTTNHYGIMVTMYIPLNSLALYLMQQTFS